MIILCLLFLRLYPPAVAMVQSKLPTLMPNVPGPRDLFSKILPSLLMAIAAPSAAVRHSFSLSKLVF